MRTAVWCLRLDDAEYDTARGHRHIEVCDSHLLIVTGRGWTPARKKGSHQSE